MNKLIKLSDAHYIIIDDSEIKEGDFVYRSLSKKDIYEIDDFGLHLYKRGSSGDGYLKITHSTQPLDKDIHGFGYWTKNIIPLFLSEVEEAIYGYSVEKIAKIWCNDRVANGSDKTIALYENGFTDGFKAHQELVKDELFTIKQTFEFFNKGMEWMNKQIESDGQYGETYTYHQCFKDVINSFTSKTEWDCTIDEQGKIILI